MNHIAAKLLLIVIMLSALAFPQGSTGRRGFGDPNYVVTRTVSEKINAIDLKRSELTLNDWDGKPHTVKVTKDTKLTSGGHAIALADLRAGQWVRYTYRVADATALDIRLENTPRVPPNK